MRLIKAPVLKAEASYNQLKNCRSSSVVYLEYSFQHISAGPAHPHCHPAKVLANYSQNNGRRKGIPARTNLFGYSCWAEKQSIFAGCCALSSPKGKTRMSELHLKPGGDCWQRNQHRQESAQQRGPISTNL